MCYEIKLFEDTTIVSKINYEPNCHVPDNCTIIPRWLSHLEILSEKEEIHLELDLYFLKENVAYQCIDLIVTYIHTLIQQNELRNAVDFYNKIRMIKDYAKNNA